MYVCTQPDDPKVQQASTSLMSMRVHYNNEDDGCDGLSAFDAYTGVIPPLLGFHEFKGDDGFSANLELLSSHPGLHIKLDDKEVHLGDASKSTNVEPKYAVEACKSMGLEDNTGRLPIELTILDWYNVPKTKCK